MEKVAALSERQSSKDELRRLRREAKVAAVLREVAGALGASLELDELLELVLGRLRDLLEAEGTLLFLLDERKRELVSRVPGSDTRLTIEVGDGLLGGVVRTGRLARFSRGEAIEVEWDGALGTTTDHALVAPLKNNLSRTIGLMVAFRTSGGAYSEDDEEVLGVLAKQAAIAIDNSRLLVTLIRKNQQLQQAQEQLTRRVRDLELLFELERATAHADSHEALARAVLERLARACNAEAALLSLREGESGELVEFRLDRAPRRLGASEDPPSFRTTHLGQSESLLGQVFLTRSPLQFESPTALPPGEPGPLRSLLAEPLDGDDAPIGALAVLNRRTGPFTAEDLGLVRLVSANVSTAVRLFDASLAREKQERLSSIGRLLSQVVHDLKSPLTVISGYVELMRDAKTKEERARYADEILKQFQTLGAMQREVLAFARGETQVFSRKVIVDRFFAEIAPVLALEVPAERIELRLAATKKLVAHFDSERITRALSNLVRNAVEAIGEGRGSITIEASAEGETLVFAVSDDGPGVPKEISSRLFESFVTYGKKDGTGLGLAIVQRIAVEHGGRVELGPSARGAKFVIRLPGAVATPRAETKNARSTVPESGNPKARTENPKSRTEGKPSASEGHRAARKKASPGKTAAPKKKGAKRSRART